MAEDEEFGYLKKCGRYRKHIIFDLLKYKADEFYNMMIERREREKEDSTADTDSLS